MFQRERESDLKMSGEEEQQQLVPRLQPWVYIAEEEVLNGHTRDVPP